MAKKNKARDIKPSHLKRLSILSGNQCAHPECARPLIAEDGITIIGKACHIHSASKGGPRFDPLMSDDQRRHFDNLIYLCDEHHAIIDNKDNEADFPAELLKSWKASHERTQRDIKIGRSSALLIEAINALSLIHI